MPRFYVEGCSDANKSITITGEDVNHIKNVLRMKHGEELIICDGEGMEYVCEISQMEADFILADIVDIQKNAAELPCKITLFQGMPKSDKLEFIIQKAVELGVTEIVPVITKRTVVKIEDKKKKKKIERYNAIAESAAKQSGRGIIPKVTDFMTWKQALNLAKNMKQVLLPYENAEGMQYAKKIIEESAKLPEGSQIGIFIGPEGGFATEEVETASEIGAKIISLGNRILRTETAGLTVLSILMFAMEE